VTDVSGTRRSFVIFRLGREEYGLPIATVGSVIRWEPATAVPRAPEGVMGVINLRGRVIPVLDLGRRFGQEPFEPTPTARIIVAEGNAGGVGIAVDAAKEVGSFSEEDIRPVPEGILSADTARAFTGVVEREGSLVILVDLDEAMPRSEFASAMGDTIEEEGADV
jgi:purine-binding chemotaxis protein CheW